MVVYEGKAKFGYKLLGGKIMKVKNVSHVLVTFLFLFLVLFIVETSAYADCATDSIGTVYCSKEPGGGAAVDSIGTVHCGKGQCKRDSIGTVYCSKETGGGAAVDSLGTVKCTGGCELGSTDSCERAE